ncbi:UDP-glucose 4-epimerase [archaeon]|nr:UDP-glucose 4-epimerase [archaeon]
MKVCVTGGAGFIGSHVVEILKENGHDVFVIDDLSTGNQSNISDDVTLYETSILSPELSVIFKREKPEVIVHHAAQINVRNSVTDPLNDGNINVLGSINLIENAVKANVKKIVYASSGGAVYGNPQKIPCDETHSIAPTSPYGTSKFTVEKYLETFRQMSGLGYTILRYANVYGPRQDPKGEAGVIAVFYDKLKQNETPLIFGEGTQTRDYVYVKDVAQANLLAVEKPALNTYFNIGSGVQTNLLEMVELMRDATGKKIEPKHIDPVIGDVEHIALDCQKAKDKLGWGVSVSLKDGLKKTWDTYK